jgi:hypothetical protein
MGVKRKFQSIDQILNLKVCKAADIGSPEFVNWKLSEVA